MLRSPLHRCLNGLGITAVIAYAVMTALSYVLTPALWQPAYSPNSAAFFGGLFGADGLAAIRSFFGGATGVLIWYSAPLLAAGAAAVALIFLLSRDDSAPNDETARLVFRWSLAFAGVNVLAFPVLTQDFWLSAIWGNMVASGTNPYYHNFTPAELQGFPLDHFPMTMSYGPLWALISAAIMTLTGGSVWAAAILFKLVLLAAWLGTLLLVDRIMRQTAPASRALGLVVVGWVPLGVSQTVAEGHNDIAMVLPALLWLFLLLRGRFEAPLALAASMLCKYTTAPLFFVDALHNLRGQRIGPTAYARRLALPLLVSVAVMGIFYRSLAFFDGVDLINTWHFMQPIHALAAIGELVGGWFTPVSKLALAIFPTVAIHQIWLYWKAPDKEQLLRVTLAVMCAVTFSALSHIWPWYLVWTLPLAALVPGWWLSRFVVGLCLTIPFTAVVWWVPEAEDFKNIAALLMYLAAILWTLLTARGEAETEIEVPGAVRHMEFARVRSEPAPAHANSGQIHEGGYRSELRLRAEAVSSETSV